MFSRGSAVSASVWNNARMLELLMHQPSGGDAGLTTTNREQHQATFSSTASTRWRGACTFDALGYRGGLAPMSCAVDYAYTFEAARPSLPEEADPRLCFWLPKVINAGGILHQHLKH